METTDSIEFNIENDRVCMQSDCRVQASVLRAMFDDDNLCDVSLYGKPASNTERNFVTRPIRAYKAVLAHASSHLYHLFTVDGFIDSHRSEYRIDDVDHESLRNIVTFIHTDKLKLNTANVIEQVCGILIGAKYLIMPKLADACESFLAAGDGQLKISNCVKLWCFARKYSCLELMHASSTLIAKHVCYMRDDAEFLRMSDGDCSKLLMSEAFIAADAEARYNAAIKWLLYDGDGRARHVRDILNMVPFTSGEISFDAVLQAEECDLLKNEVPDMVHQAMVSVIKRANGALRAANSAVVDRSVSRESISKRGARGACGGGFAPEAARMLKQVEETHAMEPRGFLKYPEKQHKGPFSKDDNEYEKHVNGTEPYTQRLWPVMPRMPGMNYVTVRPQPSYNSHMGLYIRSDNQRGVRGDNLLRPF